MKIDYKHFAIDVEHISATGWVSVLWFNSIKLTVLCTPCTTKYQALRVGIKTFRGMLADDLSESEGIRCTLRQKSQTAVQLANGWWSVGDKVYSDSDFRRLFDCD